MPPPLPPTHQAPFYLGKFPEAAANFSVLNACIVGGVGATSALLGGRLADRLASRSASPDAARMLVRAPPSHSTGGRDNRCTVHTQYAQETCHCVYCATPAVKTHTHAPLQVRTR